jgi:hypothetical protein
MNRTPSLLLAMAAGLGLSLASGNVMADTKDTGQNVAVEKPAVAKVPMHMTDAQLGKIVAGTNTPTRQIVYVNGVCYYVNSGTGNTLGKTCH